MSVATIVEKARKAASISKFERMVPPLVNVVLPIGRSSSHRSRTSH